MGLMVDFAENDANLEKKIPFRKIDTVKLFTYFLFIDVIFMFGLPNRVEINTYHYPLE